MFHRKLKIHLFKHAYPLYLLSISIQQYTTGIANRLETAYPVIPCVFELGFPEEFSAFLYFILHCIHIINHKTSTEYRKIQTKTPWVKHVTLLFLSNTVV